MYKPSFPIRASILITNRCNYHCKHCYTSAGDLKFDELNTRQWKNVMDELESNGVFELYIGGGEPFVRRDVFQLFDYSVHNKRFMTTTSTDAALINKENVNKLDDSLHIQVSIDGYGESHEAVRGPNTYVPTIRGLDLLLEYRKNVGVGTVVNRLNQNDLEKIHDLLIEKNVPSWHVMRVQPSGRALAAWSQLSITNQEWVKAVKTLKSLSEHYKTPQIDVNGTFRIGEAKKIKPEDAVFYFAPEAGREICILPNGDVIPTDIAFGLEKYVIGNVLKSSLSKIWDEAKVLENFLKTTNKIKGKCNSCEVFEICRGGSRIVAEVLTKDLFAPDPYCPNEPPNYVDY